MDKIIIKYLRVRILFPETITENRGDKSDIKDFSFNVNPFIHTRFTNKNRLELHRFKTILLHILHK